MKIKLNVFDKVDQDLYGGEMKMSDLFSNSVDRNRSTGNFSIQPSVKGDPFGSFEDIFDQIVSQNTNLGSSLEDDLNQKPIDSKKAVNTPPEVRIPIQKTVSSELESSTLANIDTISDDAAIDQLFSILENAINQTK